MWSIIAWYKNHFEIYWEYSIDCSNESNGHYIEGDSDLDIYWHDKDSILSFKRAIEICKDTIGFRMIVPWFIAYLIGKK